MNKKAETLNFEESLSKLEDIVNKLESGQVDLENAITLYSDGETLKKNCEKRLQQAKLKVEKVISYRNGNAETEDFSA